MNYLKYIEHAAENLQFYLWFYDYSARFNNLAEGERALSPEWTREQAEAEAASASQQTRTKHANAEVNAILKDTSFDDLGAATFATGGCYVFGVSPSGYPTTRASPPNRDKSTVANLLDGVLRTKPDVLIGVPWMLQGIQAIHSDLQRINTPESLEEAVLIRYALVGLKYLGLGGAQTTQETLRWAMDLGIKVVKDMGMTELGGEFHKYELHLHI